MENFTGKKVLVTGSTQGIGYATAKAFVETGAEVTVHCSRDEEKAKRVAAEIGAAHAVVTDLSEETAAAELYEKAGFADVLVLNASVQVKQPWDCVTRETMDRQFQINFRSSVELMQLYVPKMEERGWGRVIVVGSVNHEIIHPELSVYGATKGALLYFVRQAAKASAMHGVTVNNVSPGAISTPRNLDVQNDPVKFAAFKQKVPMGRFGTSEEVAACILFLAGEQASYITGADLRVDGGLSLK